MGPLSDVTWLGEQTPGSNKYQAINLETIKPRALTLKNDQKIPRMPPVMKDPVPSPDLYKPDFN